MKVVIQAQYSVLLKTRNLIYYIFRIRVIENAFSHETAVTRNQRQGYV